jgi:putative tRNA adenosine deaminase-associated protein
MNQAFANVDDFGVIAWREEGIWRISPLSQTRDLSWIMDQLRAQQGDGGSLALVAIDEEFFIIARCVGRNMQMMVSDITYSAEYEVAADLIDMLDLPFPEEDDEPQPGGDIDLLNDYGISAMELEVMSDDLDLYPEEQIAALAGRLGFGEEFEEIYDRN